MKIKKAPFDFSKVHTLFHRHKVTGAVVTMVAFAFTMGPVIAEITGPNGGLWCENDAVNGGALEWTDPANACGSPGSYATATIGQGVTTNYLKSTNFGFSIDSSAVINGIQVSVMRNAAAGKKIADSSVKLVKGGTIGGDDKALATSWPLLDASVTYGGTNDKWGTTWTPSDINSTDFGVAIAATFIGVGPARLASIDRITITVDYTIPAKATNVTSSKANGSYKPGVSIPITVTFDQVVTVTGTPQLTLETGTSDAVVNYSSGSGSNTLTFNYIVSPGETVSDLNYINTDALTLNGGLIKNGTAESVLTLPELAAANSLGTNKNIVIDTTTPTLSAVSIASNNANAALAKAGDNVVLSFTASETIGTPSVAFKSGGVAVTNAPVISNPSADNWTAAYTVSGLDTNGEVSFTINYSDLALNAGDEVATAAGLVTVDTIAPTFAMQYYSDSDLTTPLADNARLMPGTYYIKITSSETLSAEPTISIEAEGTNNDVSNFATTPVSGNDYKYIRNIVSDGSAVGAVLEDVSVSGSDPTGNASSNIHPTNESSKAAYTDTVAPTFSMQYFSNAALTTVLADNSSLKVGTYYIKITSNETLSAAPTISIAAEGTNNDVSNDATALVSGKKYTYTRVIASDAAAVGSALEDFSVSGTDSAGNVSSAVSPANESTKTAYTDTTAPTVADLSTTASDPTNVSPISVSATFSENVRDFTKSNITVNNGTVGSFTGSGTSYTFNVTPAGEGLVNIDIAGDVVHDAAGNGNSAATQLSRTFESESPTTTISTTATDSTNVSPIPVTITFSKDVTGFDDSDIVVGNGTKSNFSAISGSVYKVDITPDANGAVTVNVGDGAAQDEASNNNSAATQLSVTYDTQAPTLSENTQVPAFTNVSEPNYKFNSDEAGDITYFGDCSSPTDRAVSGANEITFNSLGDGLHNNCTIVVTDAVGYASIPLVVSAFTVDTEPPSILNLSTTAAELTNSSAIPFSVTFSENMTGFTADDVTVTNGAVINFNGSGSVYTFDVNPTLDGVITVQILAGVAQDFAGNYNYTASNTISRTVDRVVPQVTEALVKDTNGDGRLDRIDLTLNEDLVNTEAGSNDFDVYSNSEHGACIGESADPEGSTLSVTFSCSEVNTAVGDLTLSLSANENVRDAAGNKIVLDLSEIDFIDDAKPIVTSTTPADGDGGVAVGSNVIANFSEPVSTASLEISDDDNKIYSGAVWSNGNRTVTLAHTDWSNITTVKATVVVEDLNTLSLYDGSHRWSFLTQALSNQGCMSVPFNVNVNNDSGLDLSTGISTAEGENILLNCENHNLSNLTLGDLENADLSGPQTVGDQTTTVTHGVTVQSTQNIIINNPAMPGKTFAVPNNTTLMCGDAWDGTIVLQPGSSSGVAPTGFSVGDVVIEAGSPGCVLLADKPITITLAGVTGPIAFKAAGSNAWNPIAACGGTYAAPTLAAPVSFRECAISNGSDTKIVTYHLTTFSSLVVAGSSGSSQLGGGGSAAFGRPACSGDACLPGGATANPAPVQTTSCDRNESTEIPFTDIATHWAKGPIESLYKRCIVEGKSKYIFAPEANIIRAELVKILVKNFNPGTTAYQSLFKDVSDKDWFAPYAMQAFKTGLVKGRKINKFITLFDPLKNVTRAEAIAMILKANGVNLGSYNSTFSDVKRTDDYYASVAFAQAKGLATGKILTLGKSGLVSKFYSFPVLSSGEENDYVAQLKSVLMQLDYYRGDINNIYDAGLVDAVKAYQKAKNIFASGEFTLRTRVALMKESLSPKVIRYFNPDKLATRAEVSKWVVFAENL